MSSDQRPNPTPYQPPQSHSTEYSASEAVDAEVVSPRHRGNLPLAVVAWIIILAIATLHVLEPYIFPPKDDGSSVKTGLAALKVQGKYLLGTANIGTLNNSQIADSAETLNSGPFENRLCHAIMVNELSDADAALETMGGLQSIVDETGYELTDEQQQLQSTLEKLLVDYQVEAWEAPSISQPERDQLESQLGWFGKLALNPANAPDQTARYSIVQESKTFAIGIVIFGLFALLVVVSGFVGFFVFSVLVGIGNLKIRTPNFCGNGRIYVETFAVWFLMFLGFQILAAVLIIQEIIPDSLRLPALLVASFASMACLLWPRLRGIPWRETAGDLGLRCKNVFVEMFWGVVSYISSLPILIGGVIVSGILMAIFGPQVNPNDLTPDPVSHPAMEWLSQAGIFEFIMIALLTVVSAPLIEETVFRGLLYRHLRDASHRWGRILSVIFAAVLNSLLFAAIHPQGVFAIPVLGSLALAFTLVREWRGSLYAPMTMHAVHNGSITCIWIFLMM